MNRYLVAVDTGGQYSLTESGDWELKDKFGNALSPEIMEDRVSEAKQAITNILELHGGSIGEHWNDVREAFYVETSVKGANAMLRLGGILETVQYGRNVHSARVPTHN